MKTLFGTIGAYSLAAFIIGIFGCAGDTVDVDEKDRKGEGVVIDRHNGSTQSGTKLPPMNFFPYTTDGSWWKYSAGDGNQLTITVNGTISDDDHHYFKLRFQEENRDTTDDWFKGTPYGVEFSTSLQGEYSLFLPTITHSTGTFSSGSINVTFTHNDSTILRNQVIKNTIKCEYSIPLLHGFDQIYFADGIGITSLVDTTGRYPTEYLLDSCKVNNQVTYFVSKDTATITDL
jgi:hypothetical protein